PNHHPYLRHLPLLRVSTMTSGTNGFHDVTGGVYKAWERIHGAVADAPLLAIPASCRRVADDNLNWARFLGICSILRSCFPLCRALYYVCSPGRKGHTDLTSSSPSSSFKRGSLSRVLQLSPG